MLLKTKRKKPKQNIISTQEAYNLWKLLDNRYMMVNNLKVRNNFSHDKDFKYILEQHLNKFENEIAQLERELEKYSIKGPTPNIREVNVKGNFEIERDKDIAWALYYYLSSDLTELIRILRDALTNDDVRGLFLKILKGHLNTYYEYTDYLKTKGWISIPPLYQYVPDNVDQRIAVNEVFNLYSHLIFRYANVHLTKYFSSFVSDLDLKALFDSGTKLLERQSTKLEKLLSFYGVNLPEPYSNVIPTPESGEPLEDKFMFFSILEQMQNASAIHGQALKDSIVNDEVRSLFKTILLEEIDVITNMIKFGKMKGWTPASIPGFKMG